MKINKMKVFNGSTATILGIVVIWMFFILGYQLGEVAFTSVILYFLGFFGIVLFLGGYSTVLEGLRNETKLTELTVKEFIVLMENIKGFHFGLSEREKWLARIKEGEKTDAPVQD